MEYYLPFRLTIVLFIFNLFEEGLHWLLEAYLPLGSVAHYLDDFITVISASEGSLPNVITTFNNVFNSITDALRIPQNEAKDSASTLVTVLSVKIDTLSL